MNRVWLEFYAPFMENSTNLDIRRDESRLYTMLFSNKKRLITTPVGKQYQSQLVTITMDAQHQRWIVTSDKAKIIYKIDKPFSVRQLCHLSSSPRT